MALKSSEEFLRTALTNNTFDVDALDKALRMTLDNSFSYLYRLQRNTIPYEEFFYTTQNVKDQPDYGDFYLDKKERVCVNIPAELILSNARERYRRSSLFKEEIPLATLKNDHVMFERFPVIIIDNQVLRDFSVRVYDDFFTLILPFKRDFLYTKKFDTSGWNYEYIEHTLSVQIINNTFYEDLKTNTGMLMKNSMNEKSFDRIKASYLTSSGFALPTEFKGTMFAILFYGNEYLGSLPQEITTNEDGDYIVNYDEKTKEKLSNYSGQITVRFLFYRYLYKHNSYRYDGIDYKSSLVTVREKDDTVQSELFLISDSDDKLYGMPVPTENLLIYHKENNTNTITHFSNENVRISYPNIYRVEDNVNVGDTLNVFYFYIPPYDLNYKYMYQFYYAYLKYKWADYSLEKIVNMIYFGDYDLENDPMLEILPDKPNYEKEVFDDPEGARLGLFYEWVLDPENRHKSVEELEEEFNEAHKDDELLFKEMTDEEKAEYLEKMKPIRLGDFMSTFNFIIDRPIKEYFYDEMDYSKKYMDTLPPLEYKVNKLQDFIDVNFNSLHNFIMAQQLVTNKYEFTREEACLDRRYSEINVSSGSQLIEPCYVFDISKDNPDVMLTARMFVDGLFVSNFIYDRHEYNDQLYIPIDMVPDNAKYFEIEIFPSLVQSECVTFTTEKPSVIVDFESTDRIQPTLSDLFFHYGKEKTLDRIPLEYFRLEVVSTQYNYVVSPSELINIYKKKDGTYYNEFGCFFNYEGQRIREKDISIDELQNLIDSGEVSEAETVRTSDLMEIERDQEYVTFDKIVTGGESIINRENKGVNFTILRKLKITAINADLFGREVTIGISKTPYYFTKTAQNTCFPIIDIHADNLLPIDEYTRVFKNGRLRSRNRYDFRTFDGKLQFRALESLNKRESLTVDVTPYRNRLIYYDSQLSSDLVDLRGFIDKPFDMKYYEIYLNGRKLNKLNVFPISPYEIKLAGIHSYYNLEIYERDKDWEYFDISFDNYFTLSNLIKESYMESDIKGNLIHDITGDTLPNENVEDPEPWSRENDTYTILFAMFYYERVVELGHLNPEMNQFEIDDIRKNYGIIDKLYRVQNDKGEDVYLLNPDIYYKPENPSSKERWRTFLLGNRDPEEFL